MNGLSIDPIKYNFTLKIPQPGMIDDEDFFFGDASGDDPYSDNTFDEIPQSSGANPIDTNRINSKSTSDTVHFSGKLSTQ